MQLPAKQEGLTEQQRRLAVEIAAGRTMEAASQLAGYADPMMGYDALSLPAVEAFVHKRIQQHLTVDAAQARRHLRRVMRGTKQDAKLRAAAAKDLLSRGGFVPPKAREATSGVAGTLSELTPAQLRALVDAGQRALADRAPVIEGETIRADNAPETANTQPNIAELLG